MTEEVIFRVRATGKGAKVVKLDGYGLREGLFAKSHLRYFYGDDARYQARLYAEERAHDVIENEGKVAKVQPLGSTESQDVEPRDDICECGHFPRSHRWAVANAYGSHEFLSSCRLCDCDQYEHSVKGVMR